MFQVLVPGCAWDTILLVARGGRDTILFVLVSYWGSLLLVPDDGGGKMYDYLNINSISSVLQNFLSKCLLQICLFLNIYTPSIIRYK